MSHGAVEIDGISFDFVQNRLLGGKVYRHPDGSSFVRLGSKVDTLEEEIHTRTLHNRGYPVPEVIAHGERDGEYYFIETSLGSDHFGAIFMNERTETGIASQENFGLFETICAKYFEAQSNPKNYLRKGEDIDGVARIPELIISYDDLDERKLNAVLDKLRSRLGKLPSTYLQTDLNAFNIMPQGIIDFEYMHAGPVGYDVATNIHFGRFFPKNEAFDMTCAYEFSDEQINHYSELMDDIASQNRAPKPSDYLDDFLVLKSMWGASKGVRSRENPNRMRLFWLWRREVMERCMDMYLADVPIDTSSFQEVDQVILAHQ
ncbi:MAG: hypothetical protein JWO35_46 [Candidatus Saccharibacteria bacterium]|nr:hypothetical protein [Candidatus Saccharibacteria bacterium]